MNLASGFGLWALGTTCGRTSHLEGGEAGGDLLPADTSMREVGAVSRRDARTSPAGAVIQPLGTSSLGGQFDHRIEGGGRDVRQIGKVERHLEQCIDLHGPAREQVLHDALAMTGGGQFAEPGRGVAGIAA